MAEITNEPQPKRPSQLRIVMAALLDFVTVFSIGGFIIATLAGQTTEKGFALTGGPAILFVIVIVAYFLIGSRSGGTLWQRILRTR